MSLAPGLAGSLSGRRILIIVENLAVPFDRRVWLEARTLRDAGAEVSVICPQGVGAMAREEVLEGIRVFRHPLPEARGGAMGYLREYAAALFWETLLAWRVWRRHGFDTIQGCNPPDLIFLVALQFRLLGVGYIFDHHDINPELWEAKFSRRGPFWHLLRLVERLSFRSARLVIATNESYRRIAMGRGGRRGADVIVVRSGPDLSRLRPVAPDPAWAQGRAALVGYVGVMGPQEGIDLLLAAARVLVVEEGRDVQFCLAGDGPVRAEMMARAEAMGLSAHVSFPGRIADDALFEMLSSADICVNPDRVNPMNDKSTMNKILEYMAFGKPIVQFEVTEGRVSAGPASLYARANDPGDFAAKLARLLDDPALRARMGAEGRARVTSRFGWEHEAPKLVEAYRRAAPKRLLPTRPQPLPAAE